MSSTTRIGFTIPAVTDFADETLYFDNNVTIYENELPSVFTATLPSSGNYAGQIRVQNVAQNTGNPAPQKPYFTRLYNGTAWIPAGSAGVRTINQTYSIPSVTGNYFSASGVEVFDSAPIPYYTALQTYLGGVLKFCCSLHLDLKFSSDSYINGKFNIFINPASSAQPTPTTPGAVRLSFPLIEGKQGQIAFGDQNGYAMAQYYGEMLYASTANTTVGVAAYLSLTNTDGSTAVIRPEVAPYTPSIGILSLQLNVESMGVFDG